MSGRCGQCFQTGLGNGHQFDGFVFALFFCDIAYPLGMDMHKKNQVGAHRTKLMSTRCQGTLAWLWSQEARGATGLCFEPV